MIIKNSKFLIIDDDPFTRTELIKSLHSLDFMGPYVEACDGEEGIKKIRENISTNIDFIICDIYMPKMDGISFLSHVKNEQLLERPTPILMLTAENDRKVVVECMKLGATNYLLKPWNQTDLAKKLVSSWDKIHSIV